MATAAASILKLFENNDRCEVRFKVKCGSNWTSFPAHKLVLSIWSPFWANKFQGNDQAYDGDIEISDILPSTFHAFFRYLYSNDSKKELEKHKNDVKFILSIYEVAMKYQVQRLQIDCRDILNSSSPNKNNVFDLLDAAILINSNPLEKQCFKVLQTETEEILNTQDVNSVTPTMVETLLQLPSLCLSSEYDLLTWVFKWAKSYCSLQNVNTSAEVISPFLPYFNFTALESKDFAILVSNHKEFFDEVECFNIFMKINLRESTDLPANASSRRYTRRAETAGSATLGDGMPELSYTINNLPSCNSGISNYNASSTTSISSSTEDTVMSTNVGTNVTSIVDNGSVKISLQTADKETMTDVAIDINTEVQILPNDISLQSSANNNTDVVVMETKDDVTMDAKDDVTMDAKDDVAMDTKDDVPTSSGDDSTVSLKINNSNDISSTIEITERGQSNTPVLETVDTVPGISWELLEPPLHLEKIKKKKIVKSYLLPEGKSLPSIGKWDPEFESALKSRDINSLSYIIERQRSLTVATEKPPSTGFPLYVRFLST